MTNLGGSAPWTGASPTKAPYSDVVESDETSKSLILTSVRSKLPAGTKPYTGDGLDFPAYAHDHTARGKALWGRSVPFVSVPFARDWRVIGSRTATSAMGREHAAAGVKALSG